MAATERSEVAMVALRGRPDSTAAAAAPADRGSAGIGQEVSSLDLLLHPTPYS